MAETPPQQLPLFVYGTLRPGEQNFSRYLQPAVTKIQPGTINARLFSFAGDDYPFILPGPGLVVGELVDIQPALWLKTLSAVDRLEDYDPQAEASSWYLRRQVSVRRGDGVAVLAWTYYWNRPETLGTLLPGGDWRQRPRPGSER